MAFQGGYAGYMLEVDLTAGKFEKRPLDEGFARKYVGGRGFTSRLQYELIPPEVDPLSPENPLIVAPGPLTGTRAPAGSRFTVGGRSPLTGILGDANSGGHWGPELKRAGFDLLVLKGQSNRPVYLWIHDGEVEIRDASHLWGKDTRQTRAILVDELGGDEKIKVAAIGQAGENLVKIAGFVVDVDHLAARTGLGALMGSKKLKAIAVRGTQPVPLYDKKAFQRASGVLNKILLSDQMSGGELATYGTTSLLTLHNTYGGLATRNWQTGVFEGANKIDGVAFNKSGYAEDPTACFACPCRCDRAARVDEGEYAGTQVGGPEYYTVCSFGSKLGNDNLASILKANELCNLYGLDTGSTGGIIGFLMEAWQRGALTTEMTGGLDFSWGNHRTMIEIIHQIAHRQGLGDKIAEGIRPLAEWIGNGAQEYAMHVKGMDPVTFDPRALRVYNFRYAVASRGADHLRISAHGAYGLEELPVDEAAHKMKFWQDIVGIPDLMGVCKFPYSFYSETAEVTFRKVLELLPELYSAATGWEITGDDLKTASERMGTVERAFNSRLGLTAKDDVLPKRFLEEPLPAGPKKGQVMDILEPLKRGFYEAQGWDVETGIPTRNTLERLGLEDIADDLEDRDLGDRGVIEGKVAV
jgi:aldehyde:ferredoxin oxidoreductase